MGEYGTFGTASAATDALSCCLWIERQVVAFFWSGQRALATLAVEKAHPSCPALTAVFAFVRIVVLRASLLRALLCRDVNPAICYCDPAGVRFTLCVGEKQTYGWAGRGVMARMVGVMMSVRVQVSVEGGEGFNEREMCTWLGVHLASYIGQAM